MKFKKLLNPNKEYNFRERQGKKIEKWQSEDLPDIHDPRPKLHPMHHTNLTWCHIPIVQHLRDIDRRFRNSRPSLTI